MVISEKKIANMQGQSQTHSDNCVAQFFTDLKYYFRLFNMRLKNYNTRIEIYGDNKFYKRITLKMHPLLYKTKPIYSSVTHTQFYIF